MPLPYEATEEDGGVNASPAIIGSVPAMDAIPIPPIYRNNNTTYTLDVRDIDLLDEITVRVYGEDFAQDPRPLVDTKLAAGTEIRKATFTTAAWCPSAFGDGTVHLYTVIVSDRGFKDEDPDSTDPLDRKVPRDGAGWSTGVFVARCETF